MAIPHGGKREDADNWKNRNIENQAKQGQGPPGDATGKASSALLEEGKVVKVSSPDRRHAKQQRQRLWLLLRSNRVNIKRNTLEDLTVQQVQALMMIAERHIKGSSGSSRAFA